MTVGADRFVAHDGAYLLSHSIGLPVRRSRVVLDGYLETWETHTADAWPRWLDGIERFRVALAGLLSTESAAICPQSNVSSGLTKLLGSLRAGFDQPRILISDDAFPSLGFVCDRSGYDVRYLPQDIDVTDPSAWTDHLDGVDIAVITHVHSNTGECVPVREVADAVHAAGALAVVDVAQSVGIIPIDLGDWAVDAVVGSCVKWLSGGPGAGWLWVSSDVIERSRPTDVGWFSHEQPFEFDIHDYRDAPDALRFWGGSPTVLPFLLAAHSIQTIDAIGVQTIREHNLALTDHLVAELGDGVTSPHDRARRSGTAIVRADPSIVDELSARGIGVDHRADGIRVSPHVHTTISDLDALVDTLRNTSDRHAPSADA
ncbi:MAG: aminotransferase class V-fold PLP-dependent enzyme [Ilumatobacter sp.]|uniref:aminotransferase class V-fold PLP-dependent enzyme n=1 Tax=Ilumatobacter sp. TaxID=1967498 RepID=UPI003C70CB26